MNRAQYNRLRGAFLSWATAEGYSVGSDEGGYNDDEPAAAAIWKQWLAALAAPEPEAAPAAQAGAARPSSLPLNCLSAAIEQRIQCRGPSPKPSQAQPAAPTQGAA